MLEKLQKNKMVEKVTKKKIAGKFKMAEIQMQK